MITLTDDPIWPGGIKGFGERLRRNEITAKAVTRAYLERIELLEPRLGAFEYVAVEQSLAAARALDELLAAGIDLGPLMGVPVAIKDLFAVDGMPTTAGSNLDVTDLIGPEGEFIKMLKRAGCIIIGKTKMPEFTRSGIGISHIRGTPWNPWDIKTQRISGGSSSGSAVAVAAGLSAFAIGTDTGGSVRLPAALCGIFGLKTTVGFWPTNGALPLSPTFDTIGLLTKSAADAAFALGVLAGQPTVKPCPLRGLRLGIPRAHFFEELDPHIEMCTAALLDALEKTGVDIVAIHMPEVAEFAQILHNVVSAELISLLGRDRFLASRAAMDPDVAERTANGLEILADQYIRLLSRHCELCRIAEETMKSIDAWLSPTTPLLPASVVELEEPEARKKFAALIARNTHAVNLYGQCAATTPVQKYGSSLPVGLQVVCPAHQEFKVLSISLALEELIGAPQQPDLTPFL